MKIMLVYRDHVTPLSVPIAYSVRIAPTEIWYGPIAIWLKVWILITTWSSVSYRSPTERWTRVWQKIGSLVHVRHCVTITQKTITFEWFSLSLFWTQLYVYVSEYRDSRSVATTKNRKSVLTDKQTQNGRSQNFKRIRIFIFGTPLQ